MCSVNSINKMDMEHDSRKLARRRSSQRSHQSHDSNRTQNAQHHYRDHYDTDSDISDVEFPHTSFLATATSHESSI